MSIANIHSLHFFGKNLVNSTGQTLFALKPLNFENPEEDEMLLNMHLHQKMLEEQKTIGDIWLKYTFRYLNKKFPFTMEDLDFLINENPIIPEGRRKNISLGNIYGIEETIL